jgi:hypothetical protein
MLKKRIGLIVLATVVAAQAIAQPVVHCPDTVVINSLITVYGFKSTDIDSVMIRLYPKNNGFKTVTDTFMVLNNSGLADAAQQKGFINIGKFKKITNQTDFEIVLKNGTVFKIGNTATDMVLVRNEFKKCELVGFELNGRSVRGNAIELVRQGFRKKKVKKVTHYQHPFD